MNEVLQQFKDLGKQASYHYACDYGSEWRLGTPLEARALKLFDHSPLLQAEMRVIAKGFLWSLKSVRPESQPQQDRPLASGQTKTATGEIIEPTCVDIHDLPRSLGS